MRKIFRVFVILCMTAVLFTGCEKAPIVDPEPEPPSSVILNLKMESNCRISRADVYIPLVGIENYTVPITAENHCVAERRFGISYSKCYNEEVFIKVKFYLDLSGTGDGPVVQIEKTMTKLMDDLEEDVYFYCYQDLDE